MSILSERSSDQFADIIRVLNSGIDFYREALEEISSPEIREVLSIVMIAHKRSVARLQPYAVVAEGSREAGSDFSVEVRKTYTKVLAAIKRDEEEVYIDQLEEVEDKLLNTVYSAQRETLPIACDAALNDVAWEIRNCHELMRRLQKKHKYRASQRDSVS